MSRDFLTGKVGNFFNLVKEHVSTKDQVNGSNMGNVNCLQKPKTVVVMATEMKQMGQGEGSNVDHESSPSFPAENKAEIKFIVDDDQRWPGIRECLEQLTRPDLDLDEVSNYLCRLHASAQGKPKKSFSLEKTPYEGLIQFVHRYSKWSEKDFKTKFLRVIMPTIAGLALNLEDQDDRLGLFLMRQKEASIQSVDRVLVASILSHAFLCLLPINGPSYPYPNFDHLYGSIHSVGSQYGKLRSMMEFFYWLGDGQTAEGSFTSKLERSQMTFERAVATKGEFVLENVMRDHGDKALCDLKVIQWGLIEDSSSEFLQIDFANRYLGGGVMGGGCVQEEIMFSICPELLAGLLLMESMLDHEAIRIYGFRRCCNYTGYAFTFKYESPYEDRCQIDSRGNVKRALSAIDAIFYGGDRPQLVQYRSGDVRRELTKALVGFRPFKFPPGEDNAFRKAEMDFGNVARNFGRAETELGNSDKGFGKAEEDNEKADKGVGISEEGFGKADKDIRNAKNDFGKAEEGFGKAENEPPNLQLVPDSIGCIASGNWGCGAFRGDPQLKSMIQWLAASCAGSPLLHYYTFDDPNVDNLQATAALVSRKCGVLQLFQLMSEYCQEVEARKNGPCQLFSFLSAKLFEGETSCRDHEGT